MTTITFNPNGMAQFPLSFLQLLGVQKGGKVEAIATPTGIALQPTQHSKYTAEEQQRIRDLVEQGHGMIKIPKGQSPKGSLFDFDVGEHIALFDQKE